MNPFGIFELIQAALEGLTDAVNPKSGKKKRKDAVLSGIAYISLLLLGIIITVMVVQSLYFNK